MTMCALSSFQPTNERKNKMLEKITLYLKEGSSDKTYQAVIESSGNQFVVSFAYGRRNSTLQTGTKTNTPVDYNIAKSIYDRLIREKLSKGYSPGEDGTPYQQIDKQDSDTRPQLLNPVEVDQVPALLDNFNHWLQEKIDGVRCLIQKQGGEIHGINRRGLHISLPETVVSECTRYPGDFLLDGEMVGDTYHAFDLLQIGETDLRQKRFGERWLRLVQVLNGFLHPSIQQVETALLPKTKHELFHRLRLEEREGVVFKEVNAVVVPGRPASGGTQLKYKFVQTASFLVGRINAKRSVGLLLFDGDKLVSVGNVTIPPNHEVPKPMQIIDLRYLYAFPGGGSIYQPVYLGVRSDLTPKECSLDQLKYKPEPEQAAA